MIQATVLHPGFIIDEINRVSAEPRYLELAMALTDWHELPGHDCDDPPAEVGQMLAELKAMKVEAFVRAGERYRAALDAWEGLQRWEAIRRMAGWPVQHDTVIQYVDAPRAPIIIDFTYPA
jgi:hypothetical protein